MLITLCENYIREDTRFTNSSNIKNVTTLVKNNNCYKIFKRFSGKDKLPEIVKKAGSAAANKTTPGVVSNNNSVTPKSPTEFLRETSLQKDTLSSKESFNTPEKNDFSPNNTSSLKPLDKFDSIQDKIKVFQVQAPSNDAKSTYKGVYIDKEYHTVNMDGKQTGTVNDPDHVIVTREGPHNSLILDGRTTSTKGGIPEGEMRNVSLSSDKYDGSYTPKEKGNMKSGIADNGDFIPYRKSNEAIHDDFGNTVPHPEKGGQRYQPYAYQHIVSAGERENLGITENKQATDYLNRPDVKSILDSVHSLIEGADPVIALSQESFEEIALQEELNATPNDNIEDVD